MAYHIIRNLKEARLSGFNTEFYLWFAGFFQLALALGYFYHIPTYFEYGQLGISYGWYALALGGLLALAGAWGVSTKFSFLKDRVCNTKMKKHAFMANTFSLGFGALAYGATTLAGGSIMAVTVFTLFLALTIFNYLASGWPDKGGVLKVETQTIEIVKEA